MEHEKKQIGFYFIRFSHLPEDFFHFVTGHFHQMTGVPATRSLKVMYIKLVSRIRIRIPTKVFYDQKTFS